ncbi:MAG: 3D domain-containing protein [Planctomycetota bacterium]
MRAHAARAQRPYTAPRWALAALFIAVGALGGIVTKRATPPSTPVLAAVDRERPVGVISASHETVVEDVAPLPQDPGVGIEIEVEEIPDPLAGRSTEPTRWTDDDGVVWERAAEGFERYYNGRPLVRVKTVWMTTTAYSPDHRSCGIWADGITASMRSVWTNGMELVAADRRVLDFGSLVSIPGYASERAVPVLDVGGAIKGARLDLLYPTHRRAMKWGVQKLPVTVWAYADEVEG